MPKESDSLASSQRKNSREFLLRGDRLKSEPATGDSQHLVAVFQEESLFSAITRSAYRSHV